MVKKRILFHAEFSELSSGYAVYTKNLLTRLYKSGKYEIAEFANYVQPGDARLQSVPWKVYPVMPHPEDQEYAQIYNSSPLGQFGIFRFEQACLDFQPDIVISIFDYWYSGYIQKSPYRDFFKFMWMPTVDSAPQRPCWIDTYSLCDKVLAYSYFGKRILENQSDGRINNVTVASPGIDDSYSPSGTKDELRGRMGIPKDANIVLMVGRNQLRKLIPDFLETLSIFSQKYGKKKPDLVNKTFFYIHTSNPDSGWDIPDAIARTGCSDRIITTYICKKCNSICVSQYRGMVCKCNKCGSFSSHMTSVGSGIPRQALADIMHISDIGVLASIGEGFGMPIIEMKKVGLPVITVPYSAMEEQCVDIKCGEKRNWGGIPVKIKTMYTEPQTMQRRALFDKEDMAKKIYDVLTMNEVKRNQLSEDAIRCVEQFFTWDKCAEIWMNEIDNIDISDKLMWESTPPKFFKEIDELNIPEEIIHNPEAAVRWCLDNIYTHSYFTNFRVSEIVQSLVTGADMIDQFNKRSFDLNTLKNMLKDMINKNNMFENARANKFFSKHIAENTEEQNNNMKVKIL